MMSHFSREAFQMAQSLYPISIECRTCQERANGMEYFFIGCGFNVQTKNVKYETFTRIIGCFALRNFITVITTNEH
jgi:hypothetical protein